MKAEVLVTEAGNDGRCFSNEVDTPAQTHLHYLESAASADEDRRNHEHVETPPEYPMESASASMCITDDPMRRTSQD